MIWTHWLPFWLPETRICGKVEPYNIFCQICTHSMKLHISCWMIHHICDTAVYQPIVTYDCFPFSDDISPNNILGQAITRTWWNISMHSILHFPDSDILLCFNCIERHQPHFTDVLWLLCRPNQSGYIWCGPHSPQLWLFFILHAIVRPHVRFNVCLPNLFAVNSIILGPMPVEPMFCVRNDFRATILITAHRMTVDSCDSVAIWHFSLSFQEVLSTQSWWEWRSIRQRKRSCTIMLKQRPTWFDNFLHYQQCNQLLFSACFEYVIPPV